MLMLVAWTWALQDYDAALKLSPTDKQLRQDYETLKEALLRSTSD